MRAGLTHSPGAGDDKVAVMSGHAAIQSNMYGTGMPCHIVSASRANSDAVSASPPRDAGPEALSWRDVVAVYERVLGRPIEVRTANAGEPIPGAATDAFDSTFDALPAAAAFGVHLTRLDKLISAEDTRVDPAR